MPPPTLPPNVASTADIEVLIVDDQQPFRTASSAVVDATSGFRLWGTANSAADAIARVCDSDDRPRLILMDVNLGEPSGIEATRLLLQRWPDLRIVLVSTMAEEDLPNDARTCGARGYLAKSRLSPDALTDLALVLD